ncbi:hypothetical protein PHG31p121 [Aeromonas phage 31]|uniref:Uncharacterized protein PHG31ORF123c n=1 Tax=Aeromonas phage 31 TaxID=321023 RepID=Q56EP0_9CAUD|nr:hypothetical protein PHG31p121 [Aeromonas phage 31]AAX63610.1 hypothetical protein PHG31p121 [Aeromonas phage 31]APU01016.1 hypothetical protein [Aeromonas phage 31.2]APU01925.1 hypothetical protein [Aeromonas phage L9-6]
MKTISPTGKEKTFKSWESLREWLDERFDSWDDDILSIPFKSTVYWDLCPYAQDIHNGRENFVWNTDKDALEEHLKMIAQEI